MSKKSLVLFQDDLRLKDHPALFHAVTESDVLFPLYLYPKWRWEEDEFGGCISVAQSKFLKESLTELRYSLKSMGSNLMVLSSEEVSHISQIIDKYQITDCYYHKAYHYYEREYLAQMLKICEDHQLKTHAYESGTLVKRGDLPFSLDKMPMGFSSFRKKIEKKAVDKIPEPLPTPEIKPHPFENEWTEEAIPEKADTSLETLPIFKGGEEKAWERFEHYTYKNQHIESYKETRNGMLKTDDSTKFSPWLAVGAFSPVSLYHEIKKYEETHVANESTYWVIFELLWRDFFKWNALKFGNKLFLKSGFQEKPLDTTDKPKGLELWKKGKTGVDFVDANMRELNRTGFMSNRGRQNVASYFCKQLQLDWRWGAAYFEAKLIDFDVASNHGNWQYLAGVGNDFQDRFFNIRKQADRYDAGGEYREKWLKASP